MCGKSARWWDNEIKVKYTVGAKCIRRLLVGGKSCGMSIVDYVRSSEGEEA